MGRKNQLQIHPTGAGGGGTVAASFASNVGGKTAARRLRGKGRGKGGAAFIHPWEVQRFFHHPQKTKRRVGHLVVLKITFLEMGWKFGIISR